MDLRKPTDEQLEYARQVQAKPEDAKPYHVRERVYADRVFQLAEAPDQVDIALQALRIGDVGVFGIPFEVFAETGLELKESSPLPHSFTISFANGSHGYLPSEAQHELGGYETWLGSSVFEYQAATKIAQTLLEMLEAIE